MGLPKAVLAQQEKADELFKAQDAPSGDDVAIDVDPEILNNDDDAPVIDPDNLADFKQSQEPAKVVKKAPEPEVGDEANVLAETKAMLKKFDNENRSLKIKRIESQREISDLKNEVQVLKDQLINKDKEIAAKANEAQVSGKKFTAEERQVFLDEGFSDDIIDIFEKRGIQTSAPVDNSRVDDLEKKVETVQKTTENDKVMRFWNDLDRMAPQWDSLNEDPGFLKFLGNIPEYSNKTLGQTMQDAQNSLDVETVAKIFNDYTVGLKNGANGNNQEDLNENKQIVPDETQKKPNLEDIATPKSVNGAPPEAPPGKWTPAQITKFYQDVARNPTKYTVEQVAQIEKKYIHP